MPNRCGVILLKLYTWSIRLFLRRVFCFRLEVFFSPSCLPPLSLLLLSLASCPESRCALASHGSPRGDLSCSCMLGLGSAGCGLLQIRRPAVTGYLHPGSRSHPNQLAFEPTNQPSTHQPADSFTHPPTSHPTNLRISLSQF